MPFNKKYYTDEQIREYYKKYYREKRKKQIQEDKEKNPVYAICPMCGTKFITKHNVKYCSEACKKLSIKIKQKIYRETQKYREARDKYLQSDKYKETVKKYKQSDKYKETVKKYWQSEHGKEIAKKYSQSEKGRATSKRYYLKRKANGGKPLSETTEKADL